MLTLPPVADVVPHTGRMRLLDRLLALTPDTLTAEVTIRADDPFLREGGVGAWLAVEYMAQAIAAFAGCDAHDRDEPPAVGFLIGCRTLTTTHALLPLGARFAVHIERQFSDASGLGAFRGTVQGDDGIMVDATLSVFQPRDLQAFLREMEG